MYFIFFFFCFFVLTNGDLSCYVCDPFSPGKCESLDQNNVSVQNCSSKNTVENEITTIIRSMNLNSTEPPLCYYLYLDAGISNLTGYYRGCSNHKEVLNFCKELQTVMKTFKKTMVGCQTCRKNTCNVANFESRIDTTELPTTTFKTVETKIGNSAQTLSVAVYVITAGLYFCNL